MPSRHPNILRRETAALLLIDLQTPFVEGVGESRRVVERSVQLARGAAIMECPVLCTTQYAERMGGLMDEVRAALGDVSAPVDKLTFSCAASDGVLDRLRGTGRTQILIAGVETHICVAQTALDLLHHGYQVHVAADAVSARGVNRHKLGMEKMRDAGVIPCCAEQALFELLGCAGTPAFREVLALIKAAQ